LYADIIYITQYVCCIYVCMTAVYDCGKQVKWAEIDMCIPATVDFIPGFEIEELCFCSGEDGCNTGIPKRNYQFEDGTTPSLFGNDCNGIATVIRLSIATIFFCIFLTTFI